MDFRAATDLTVEFRFTAAMGKKGAGDWHDLLHVRNGTDGVIFIRGTTCFKPRFLQRKTALFRRNGNSVNQID